MMSLGEGKERSFNKITGKFPIILWNDLSFPSPALTTAWIAALWVIGMLAMQRIGTFLGRIAILRIGVDLL